MFERGIKSEKHTPALGVHQNYVQSFNGQVNKIGGNQDIYGNEGGCMNCGGGCMCCDMSGKGRSGGSQLPQNQKDYYGTIRADVRGRLYKLLEHQGSQLRTGGAAQDRYNGSVFTPELSGKEMLEYENMENGRFNQSYNPFAKRLDVGVPITEQIVDRNTQAQIQGIKAENDAEYDSTHGRGLVGGKKMKNPKRSNAGKAAAKKNPWVMHVKMMAKELGISYKDAVKDSKVKEAYRNHMN
jgi:hypothetical protein